MGILPHFIVLDTLKQKLNDYIPSLYLLQWIFLFLFVYFCKSNFYKLHTWKIWEKLNRFERKLMINWRKWCRLVSHSHSQSIVSIASITPACLFSSFICQMLKVRKVFQVFQFMGPADMEIMKGLWALLGFGWLVLGNVRNAQNRTPLLNP